MFIRFLTTMLMLVMGVTVVSADDEVTWKGTSPTEAVNSTDAKEQTVYLYNVGKKMFLSQGGNWGVEAVLADAGIPFKITYNTEWCCYYFSQGDSKYLYPINEGNYRLYFLTAHDSQYGYNLTETETGSGKYRISYDNSAYYMVATPVEGSTAGADANHRICVMASSALSGVTDHSDEWVLVTQKECEGKLTTAAIASKTMFEDQYAPCTYLIKDHDFARNHVNVGSWAGVTSDGTTPMVNTAGAMAIPSSTSVPSVTYYIGNGYGVDDNGQATNGGKWTANIFGNGTIKETVSDVATIGWYKVTAMWVRM